MVKSDPDKKAILARIRELRGILAECDTASIRGIANPSNKRLADEASELYRQVRDFREQISPVRIGKIGISLGRSDGIAKFFAFSFVNQPKLPLERLPDAPFYGSGVYAIYYIGDAEKAYYPLSGTETPIYVGSADPKDPDAETAEAQGQQLYKRLAEHTKNIGKTELELSGFQYRAAPIQSGMQGAVEDFMIRLFRPIWNKEIKICFGLGKHGDSSGTRRNKRSPWDTMHPGRKWADSTRKNQKERPQIESEIAAHLAEHPPVKDKETLIRMLALD